MLSGPSERIAKLLPYVVVKQDTHSYLGVVKKVVVKRRHPALPLKVVSSREEVRLQYKLLCSAQEFEGFAKGEEEYVNDEWNRAGAFGTLLREGKYPYLFYSNPVARRVYKKIGMTEVCDWRVVYTG